jgi:hypothetical protein
MPKKSDSKTPKEKKKKTKEVDPLLVLFDKGFTELQYINVIKPELIRRIVATLKTMQESKNPLKEIEEFCEKKFKGAELKAYQKVIKHIKQLKARNKKGDEVAKMMLINYGIIIIKRTRREP